MRFTLPLTAALILTLSAPAMGQEGGKLTAAEIVELLTGNTALSQHRGKPTRQSFSDSGVTFYQEEGAPLTRGLWRADESRDEYCSNWPPAGGWACYAIVRDVDAGEGHYRWQSASGYDEPFTVRAGKDLSF